MRRASDKGNRGGESTLAADSPDHQPQQVFCCWIGGHGTLPQEQNTQQSPGLGCNNLPQPGQSWKNWQASVGMVSVTWWPQCGQVSVLRRMSSVVTALHPAPVAPARCDGGLTAATDNDIGGSAVSTLSGTEAVRTSTWVA